MKLASYSELSKMLVMALSAKDRVSAVVAYGKLQEALSKNMVKQSAIYSRKQSGEK